MKTNIRRIKQSDWIGKAIRRREEMGSRADSNGKMGEFS